MTASATLGTIVKAVGLKGEIKLLPGPDFWFAALQSDSLNLVREGAADRRVHVNGFRRKGGTYILRLSGVETIDDAESVVGCSLKVSMDDLDESARPEKPLPFQLVGLEVRLPDGSVLGTIVDMLLGLQQNCLIVAKGTDKFLVPDAPEVVLRIDLDEGIVEIDPPAGLLDLRW
jgi:16S rRNA processing protein RimM